MKTATLLKFATCVQMIVLLLIAMWSNFNQSVKNTDYDWEPQRFFKLSTVFQQKMWIRFLAVLTGKNETEKMMEVFPETSVMLLGIQPISYCWY